MRHHTPATIVCHVVRIGQDTNRGRDIGRGPDVLPWDDVPRSREAQEEIARIKKIAALTKKVREIEKRHGVGQLFGLATTTDDKLRATERKIILDALALNIDVHETVLIFYGLQTEPNPPTPDFDDKEPF